MPIKACFPKAGLCSASKNRPPFTSASLSIKIRFQQAFASLAAPRAESKEKRMFHLKIAASSSIFLSSPPRPASASVRPSWAFSGSKAHLLGWGGASFRVRVRFQTPRELPEVPKILDALAAVKSKDAQQDGDGWGPWGLRAGRPTRTARTGSRSKESRLRGRGRDTDACCFPQGQEGRDTLKATLFPDLFKGKAESWSASQVKQGQALPPGPGRLP